MEPRIVSTGPWLLVGLGFYGDPFTSASEWSEDNEIGALWKRYMALQARDPDAVGPLAEPRCMLEVHLSTEEAADRGFVDVFVGARVERVDRVPLEMVVKVLPAAEYAVFTLSGADIVGDWVLQLHGEWLPAAGLEASHPYTVLFYDERFKGVDRLDESVMDVYQPVRRVAG